MDWKALERELKKTQKRGRQLYEAAAARVQKWTWFTAGTGTAKVTGVFDVRAQFTGTGRPTSKKPAEYYWSCGTDENGDLCLLTYHSNEPEVPAQIHVVEMREGGALISTISGVRVIVCRFFKRGPGGELAEELKVGVTRHQRTYSHENGRLVGFVDHWWNTDGTQKIWTHSVDNAGTATRLNEVIEPGPWDAASFTKALAAHLKRGITERPAAARRETLYAISLYTSGECDFSYICLSMNTEEALVRSSDSIELRERLRWSTPDWQFHDCDPRFESLPLPGEPSKATDKAVYAAMLAALRQSRKLVGPEVVLNVVCGDMTPRFFKRGLKELNPARLARQALKFPLP